MEVNKNMSKIPLNPGTLGITEIRIPMPWGYVAAKAWGDPKGQRVLAVHGWLDNAGTFDKLIPLLPQSFYIVAVDMPGHGRSSHAPAGFPYHYIDFVTVVRRILNYLKWDKIYYLGHSMGGSLGIMFASMFPDVIERLITLDIARPVTDHEDECLTNFKNGVSAFQSLDRVQKAQSQDPPGYTYEEAVSRLIKYTSYSNYTMTEAAAKTMLIRGTRQITEREWAYTRDQRMMSAAILRFTHNGFFDMVHTIRCHLFVILAKEAPGPHTRYLIERAKEIYNKSCASFNLIEVPGNHFVHLNKADEVSGPVTEFFLKDLPKPVV